MLPLPCSHVAPGVPVPTFNDSDNQNIVTCPVCGLSVVVSEDGDSGSGAGGTPSLLSATVVAVAGKTKAAVIDSAWSHRGRVRFRALDTEDDDAVVATSAWSPIGLYYGVTLALTGLMLEGVYSLEYQLELDPLVEGYVSDWIDSGIEWTQPLAEGEDVSESFSLPT